MRKSDLYFYFSSHNHFYMKNFIYLLMSFSLLIIIPSVYAQTDSSFSESPIVLHTTTGDISGTLTTVNKAERTPVVLIIAGSGPTDRNGNNSMMKNNSLKQVAYALATAGIASVRYDKRGVAASTTAGKKEADLRFDHYIEDAVAWVELLKKDKRFTSITIAGHSEGSLIGMIAASHADKFISIAGAGQSAYVLLKEQLSKQPAAIKDASYAILDSLNKGHMVKDVDPNLAMLFRESVQPYMISWFKFDPQVEIKKLKIPVLIIQGTNDLQVNEAEAQLLAKANPAAKLVVIQKMNHVLKIIDGDTNENMKSYNNPDLAIAPELTSAMIDFIHKK